LLKVGGKGSRVCKEVDLVTRKGGGAGSVESVRAFRNFNMYLYELMKDVEHYYMTVNL